MDLIAQKEIDNSQDFPKFERDKFIWFSGEKQAFTIRACNDRYAVCYRLSKKGVHMCTIADNKRMLRGSESPVRPERTTFGYGICEEILQRLHKGESEVGIYSKPLEIVAIR
jgi:hypothetical protein